MFLFEKIVPFGFAAIIEIAERENDRLVEDELKVNARGVVFEINAVLKELKEANNMTATPFIFFFASRGACAVCCATK
jgi:hypothetical protein